MIRLTASFGRKVPDTQEYSSRSFYASAEFDVMDSVAEDPSALKRALSNIWRQLKLAVDDEIGQGIDSRQDRIDTSNRIATHVSGSNGNGSNGNGRSSDHPASKKQVGFLLSLARRQRNLSADQTRQWLRKDHGIELDHITKSQAAGLIDSLKG